MEIRWRVIKVERRRDSWREIEEKGGKEREREEERGERREHGE